MRILLLSITILCGNGSFDHGPLYSMGSRFVYWIQLTVVFFNKNSFSFSLLTIAFLFFNQETLTDANYHAFFLLTVEILTRHWEKQILSMKFSELGAIRFDRDLRSISGYLGSQAEFGDMREKFQRLQQISTLLNLDEVCPFFLKFGVISCAFSLLTDCVFCVLFIFCLGRGPR